MSIPNLTKPLEQFTIKIFMIRNLIINYMYVFTFMDLVIIINIVLSAGILINNRSFMVKKKKFPIFE